MTDRQTIERCRQLAYSEPYVSDEDFLAWEAEDARASELAELESRWLDSESALRQLAADEIGTDYHRELLDEQAALRDRMNSF